MYSKKKITAFFLVAMLVVTACNKWKDHTAINGQDLSVNLLETISNNPDLSKFREYVGKAGLDSLLRSSKSFTVWAPTNDALAGIDAATVADTAKLRVYILNHIAYEPYFTRDVPVATRIPMVNGKYNSFSAAKFEDANLKSADKYVRNGVLHVIDKAIAPLQNIWDFVVSSGAQYAQNAFVASQNFNFFDPSLATIDSISVLTGLPVYHPGTGIVVKNYFNQNVYDLRREDRQYTYFVIKDAGLVLEADSLKPYFVTGVTTSTDSLTRINTVKDLAFPVNYATAASIPAVLTSKSGIQVPIDQSAITETKKFSNGTVYIMNKVDVPTANKFLQVTVEGENPTGFLIDRRSNTNYRVRQNPVTLQNYTDILVSGHGVTAFYSFYRLNETPSIRYKVYAQAINDFQTTALTQSIVGKYLTPPSTYTTLATLSHAVPLYTAAGAYNEIYLGDIVMTKFGTLEIQLTAATTNPITLDYLRLVPVP